MQQRAQFVQQRRKPARIEEVLHKKFARRLQVQDERRTARKFVEQRQRQLYAKPTGNRRQVDDGVGGASQGVQRAYGVLEGAPRHNGRGAQISFHKRKYLSARSLGKLNAARVHGGDGGVARKRNAKRLAHSRHRRCRAHHHAVAGTAQNGVLNFVPLLCVYAACAQFGVIAAAVGARAEFFAAPVALELRPARNQNGGDVGACRAHQQRRRGLVAAAQQHNAVKRVRADGLFHIHAHQVAEQHRSWAHIVFAQRHHREFHREAARLPHAALDRIGKLAQMGVAVRQFAPSVAYADDGLVLIGRLAEALRFERRLPKPAVEFGRVKPSAAAKRGIAGVARHKILLVVC